MKKLSILSMLFIGLLLVVAPAQAVSPYTTWTIGPGGYPVPTQDAYTPLNEIDLDVSGPEDMVLGPDGFLYVADTGNGRILKLGGDFAVAAEYGQDILQAPTGIFVDDDSTMYITDAGNNTVVILDQDGNLIKQFGRPTEPLFGANRQFLPRKIEVDARKNLYVVSEGSVDGLVMMNTEGNFVGYFGANMAEMSLKMVLQRAFLNQEQLDQFIRNEAASPVNVTIDHQSLVYTVTAGAASASSIIGKFTVSGRNLFSRVYGSNSFRDIDTSEDGLMVTVDAEGTIYEYDLNGVLLFLFGTQDRGDQRLGLLTNPTAIVRVHDDLFVLDKDKNAIVTYRVTDFARQVHDGVHLYMEGFYAEAKPYFEDVLNYNGLILMAYQGLADAEYDETDYNTALDYYRYADDLEGYSEAFWELRNSVLQRYLGSALGVLAIGWVGFGVASRLERRRKWLDPVRGLAQRARKIKLIDDFMFMFRFIRQPNDSFYYIKHNLRGSLLFAFLVFAWILIVRILTIYVTGYLFRSYAMWWQIQIETEIVYTVLPLALWIVASYLVASISDGEGSLRHVIIGTAYSLFPYVLFALPIALISNLLTLNEVFIYNFATQLMWFWCGVMLVIMVKEIHNYNISETIKNILTTLFTMAMFMLTGYILYVLFTQLYEFIMAIIQEVGLRG